jgi:hypothetical protein
MEEVILLLKGQEDDAPSQTRRAAAQQQVAAQHGPSALERGGQRHKAGCRTEEHSAHGSWSGGQLQAGERGGGPLRFWSSGGILDSF